MSGERAFVKTNSPLDRPESGTSKQDIHKTDGLDRLVTELYIRIMGIPLRDEVPERDAMLADDSEGKRAFSPQYVFFSPFGSFIFFAAISSALRGSMGALI